MSIFSSFNPFNYFFMSFIMINMMIFNLKFYNSKYLYCLNYTYNFLFNEYLKINSSLISIKLMISVFTFNILMNLNNLIPFSFCFNSQFNYLLFLSIILWLSCLMFYFSNNLKNFISHLTPSGSPLMISPLMVMIEVSSILIRPITLSVRMSANMISGHILIHLLTEFSFFLFSMNMYSMNFSLLLLIMLNFLEIGVSLIQPYIFCTLINMYLCENN